MKRFLSLFAVLAVAFTMHAQEIQLPDSYNFKRGCEAFENHQFDEALHYFNQELDNPKAKGYAYLYIAYIHLNKGEYGQMLTASDLAKKHTPKKDKAALASAHYAESLVYLELKDTTQALELLSKAIKFDPKNNYYDDRAEIYFQQSNYELSDKDYNKMLSLNPGNRRAMMGLGRNAKAQKKYDEAIPYFNKVIQLYPTYSSGYSFRAESLMQQGKFQDALNDVMEALDIDGDAKAFYLLQDLADTIYAPIVARLKKQILKQPNNSYWDYNLGIVQEDTKHYREAIAAYKESLRKEFDGVTLTRIASCYGDLGDYEHAVDYISQVIAMDSTDYSSYNLRANWYADWGKIDNAIADVEYLLKNNPEYADVYYAKMAWYLKMAYRFEKAIECYNKTIELNDAGGKCYSLLNRAVIYSAMGKQKEAESDFKKIVEECDTTDNYSLMFAYAWLGDSINAFDNLNKHLESEGTPEHYDVACVYAILGDSANAFEHIRKELENGYTAFYKMRNDLDFARLNKERFEALVSEFEEKHRQELEKYNNGDSTHFEELTTEIPFTKENGITKVKCDINGLPLHFVFDTGASDVTISAVEASFMFKNNYLSDGDVVGSQRYMDANGDVNEGTVINLKTINFGGLQLNNIRASVVHNQRAPLLLGQSVLQKLGKIEIDNGKQLLKITYQKEIK